MLRPVRVLAAELMHGIQLLDPIAPQQGRAGVRLVDFELWRGRTYGRSQ